MPSFDVVSEIDLQEVDNAVNQTAKEIIQRFDFKGTGSEITYDKTLKKLKLLSNSEPKMATLIDILRSKAIKRGLDIRSLKVGKIEPTTGTQLKCEISLVEGIDKEAAKKITKFIKESGLKVQAAIQDEKVRISGKKRDDLQEAIQSLKAQDFEVGLQFNNFRD